MDFVDEWSVDHVLGEGAFGEVRLLIHKQTGDQVALKMLDFKDNPIAYSEAMREITIHKALTHQNICHFLGSRTEGPIVYIFLEYCLGGELFDRIEPDVGMPFEEGRSFFSQIIEGVSYLHGKGIAHRDLKPENILLNGDVVKITDFGFATVFRDSKGKERLLEHKCGTLPYLAPEVHVRPYKAQPVDVWACGIIFVALLAGELPWDKAVSSCPEYTAWKQGQLSHSPWDKWDLPTLAFAKRLLAPIPSKRITIQQITTHSWMTKPFTQDKASPVRKRLKTGRPTVDDSLTKLWCVSQPEPFASDNRDDLTEEERNRRSPGFSFSQPAEGAEPFFLGSQLGGDIPCSSGTPASRPLMSLDRCVQRMTRFFVTTPKDDTLKKLQTVLEQMGYIPKVQHSPYLCITCSTTDRRKNPLIFKSHIIDMGSQMVLVDFRLSRGDGLEFKRHFVQIRKNLHNIELKGFFKPMALASGKTPKSSSGTVKKIVTALAENRDAET